MKFLNRKTFWQLICCRQHMVQQTWSDCSLCLVSPSPHSQFSLVFYTWLWSVPRHSVIRTGWEQERHLHKAHVQSSFLFYCLHFITDSHFPPVTTRGTQDTLSTWSITKQADRGRGEQADSLAFRWWCEIGEILAAIRNCYCYWCWC